MPYVLSYDPEADCIFGSITGNLDPALVREYIRKMAALAKEKHCLRTLTDLRDAESKLSVLEIDDIPAFAAEVGLDRSVRRALVIAADSDNYSFYRASSAIRGQNVRIFRDMDSAKAWLYEDRRDQK
jgi:hypothetical protein